MDRLTHLNGNNDIYFLVDGVRVRINEIEELRVAEKLKYYEDLEEQGRLVILPCKFGTPVYFIAFDKCWGGKCCWLKDGKCSKEQSPEYCPKEVLETKYSLEMYKNKTRVFLSREEAEDALRDGVD